MKAEISRAVRTLTVPGQVVELRIIGGRIASGYFDRPDELIESALSFDEYANQGVYITLNPIRSALLSRRANRVKSYLTKSDPATADEDITARRWLPVDIDPVRPSGISSSDEEHQAALDRARDIAAFLACLGFADPVIGDSGNGAHLLYRIDLPNDETSRSLVAACLQTLDIRFSDEVAHVDCANSNASRIWKLYGTMARKGDSTAERPHRRSCLISVPQTIQVISPDLLGRLASFYPPVPAGPDRTVSLPGRGKGPIDLQAWLDRYLPGYRSKPYSGGTIYLLDSCPFSAAHQDGAYAIQFANGAIFAGCHHNSCGGGVQRWQELRDRFEERKPAAVRKGGAVRSGNAAKQAPVPVSGPLSLPSPLPAGPGNAAEGKAAGPDPAIMEEADRILQEGRSLAYMLETFSRDHEGDRVVAECLIMSLASRLVINSSGLHVSITGESGKGKSHAIGTLLRQVPPRFRLDGRMSEKALFYITGLEPGSVITLDDQALSDQMQEILKGVTTSFDRPFVYHTVSKDRTGQVCTIPERCVWWIAKVEGTGDNQVFNRMLTCWIDDSDDQDLKVLERTLEHAALAPSEGVRERTEHRICQELWDRLEPAFVMIPFAARIRFTSAANRRNPDMLLDLIRSHAILMQNHREERFDGGFRCIVATEEDFHAAARLYTALSGECGGQMTKLTRREAQLLEVFASLSQSEVTIRDLQPRIGLSHSSVNKLLNGYMSRGQNYSGLLEKCPALSYLDRTVSSGADGQTTQRRVRVYTWDESLYAAWKEGDSIWLQPEDDDPGTPPDSGSPDSDDGMGGMAENRSRKQHPADLSRPKNNDDAQSDEEFKNNNESKKVWAEKTDHEASPSGVPGAGLLPSDLPLSAHDAAIAEDGGLIVDQAQETRSDSPAHLPLPAARTSSPVTVGSIDPSAFIAVQGWPQKKPCVVCGRPYTRYQERMTRERMAGPPRPNRMLCEGCYEAAKVRIALSVRTIPGVIEITALSQRSSPTGRCTVCNTGSGIWVDPAQRVSLCQTCYERERAERRLEAIIGGGG